jgi:hypothetical protein
MPTEIGLLYALCGMLSLCAGGVTLAIGALIRRLGVVAAAIQTLQGHESLQGRLAEAEAALLREPEPASEEEPVAAAAADERASMEEPAAADEPPAAQEPAAAEEPPPAHAQVPVEALAAIEAEPVALAQEDAVNENRSGHLPTLTQIEHALVEPEAAPTLVGHYSAGGANYKIFSDGSIEAETEDGAFKFASMSDFKDYLAGARG